MDVDRKFENATSYRSDH